MKSALLLDTSASMDMLVDRGGTMRRIDSMAIALNKALPEFPGTRLLTFGSEIIELDTGQPLPEPDGATMLLWALQRVLTLFAPLGQVDRIGVFCDGEPNEPEACLDAARALHCHITTIFCGDPENFAATAFMRALAWCSADGLGHAATLDLRNPELVEHEIRLLLTGPAIRS